MLLIRIWVICRGGGEGGREGGEEREEGREEGVDIYTG
jgi:hypothetical protein